jgi:uncharacterized cupin superfamily protein
VQERIDPNLGFPKWDVEMPDPPFSSRAARIGEHAGGEELGATLYEILPGGAISPYHVHHGNEEILFVLSGSPELRTPEGVRLLETGAVVAFPRGRRGAHRVKNASPEPARVLIVSTMNFPDVVEHPDTGTWLSMAGPTKGKAFPSDVDMSFKEAVLKAMQAAMSRERGG